ncbi:MAG: hypothetical protein E4H20_11150, partial [Spirochaetales bacterium]
PESPPPRLGGDELAALITALPRPAASDAAKAFLYGSTPEGEAGWKVLASAARAGSLDAEAAFHALFWYGRFLRAAERWKEAANLFSEAAAYAEAPNYGGFAVDADAARWYAIDCVSHYSTAEAVSALGPVLARGKSVDYFADLIEPLSRSALMARDGSLLVLLDTATAKIGGQERPRLAYLAARTATIGIITQDHLDKAFGIGAFASVQSYAISRLNQAYRQNSDSWYRLLAAYRIGAPLIEPMDGSDALPLPDDPSGENPAGTLDDSLEPEPISASPQISAPAIQPGDGDAYALGMADFGLAARIRAEMGLELRTLGSDTLRALSELLREQGANAESIRMIAPLFSRLGYVPTGKDRELYWPRPFQDAFTDVADSSGLPISLLYGLARSESLFQPDVVSGAGAIGLIQLMPATAGETAARLKLSEYDLSDPSTNLIIGAEYLRRIVEGQGGRVLPSLFAYNAGPTRLRRWQAASGSLPADLFLETLSYAETRQYGRNVVGAAVAYAALYDEGDVPSFMAYLLGE